LKFHERAKIYGDAYHWILKKEKPKIVAPTLDDLVDDDDSDDDEDMKNKKKDTTSTSSSTSTPAATPAAPKKKYMTEEKGSGTRYQIDYQKYADRKAKFKADCVTLSTILINLSSEEILVEMRGSEGYQDITEKSNVLKIYTLMENVANKVSNTTTESTRLTKVLNMKQGESNFENYKQSFNLAIQALHEVSNTTKYPESIFIAIFKKGLDAEYFQDWFTSQYGAKENFTTLNSLQRSLKEWHDDKQRRSEELGISYLRKGEQKDGGNLKGFVAEVTSNAQSDSKNKKNKNKGNNNNNNSEKQLRKCYNCDGEHKGYKCNQKSVLCSKCDAYKFHTTNNHSAWERRRDQEMKNRNNNGNEGSNKKNKGNNGNANNSSNGNGNNHSLQLQPQYHIPPTGYYAQPGLMYPNQQQTLMPMYSKQSTYDSILDDVSVSINSNASSHQNVMGAHCVHQQ
jgi:hypothetical protein